MRRRMDWSREGWKAREIDGRKILEETRIKEGELQR